MSDVFISYSRKDTDFVRKLHADLERTGRSIWVDWEGIPYSVDWWNEICQGIDSADTFVFVISPDSLNSMICHQEVAYARQNNKRFIPIVHHDVDEATVYASWKGQAWETQAHDNWQVLKHLNWLFFRAEDDFPSVFASLVKTIEQDPLHVSQHTRLLVRAREWDKAGRNKSALLRGDELRQAEEWLARGGSLTPYPLPLHSDYVWASRQAERQTQRRLILGLGVGLVITIGLTILSLFLYQEANRQRQIAEDNYQAALRAEALARSEALTAYSIANEDEDLQLSVLLAIEANKGKNPSPNAFEQLARLVFDDDWRTNQAVARLSSPELATLVEQNANIRDLSCAERERFTITPLCS